MFKKTTLLFVALLMGAAATAAIAEQPPAKNAQPDETAVTNENWGITIKPIPGLLKQHIVDLQNAAGIWITNCKKNSPALAAGFRLNDLLLEIDGRPISANGQLPQLETASMAIVMRRGQIQPVMMQLPAMTPRVFPPPANFGGTVSTATSFGNQAVAVSQVGNQITLEISHPDLGRQPLRLKGTRAEIEAKLSDGTISQSVQAIIRQAIGG